MWTKYNLTAEQVQGIANLAKQEQGSIEGARCEACLMADLLEGTPKYKATYGTDIYRFVRSSGWFSKAAYWMDHGDAGEGYRKVVRDVLVDGKRTLPPYVNEHDCFADIDTVRNGWSYFSVKDRSRYKPGVTVIRNRYGSEYTFWCFPTWSSDPFGLTKRTDFLPTAQDVINKAVSYLGMSEPSGDDWFIKTYNSIAGTNFGMDVAWCAIFVSVMARLIAVPESIVPTFADCDEGKAWYLKKQRYMRGKAHGGSYIPKPGDVVFYSSRKTQEDSTHVGYVVSCDGSKLRAIEGNKADAVGYRDISLSDGYIIGYGKTAEYLNGEEEWSGMNIREYVKNLYVDDLFREPSDAELDSWEKDIQVHGRNPEEVQEIFRDSPEGRQEWVKTMYLRILHREAKPDEVKAWVTAMECGESREEVMRDIQNSPEARK